MAYLRLLQEVPLEDLADIKANSIAEWIAFDPVKRTIAKSFREFLMSFTDKDMVSVYGSRVDSLGQSKPSPPLLVNFSIHFCIQETRNLWRSPSYISRTLTPPSPTSSPTAPRLC